MTVAIPFLIVALLGNFETVNYTEGERKESSGSVEAESESVNQKMVAPEHPALARLLLLEGGLKGIRIRSGKCLGCFPMPHRRIKYRFSPV